MKPWDKQLDEKLQQALNRLGSDVTDAQWLRLSQKLDTLDHKAQEDDEKIGAPLQNIEGEVSDSQWTRLSDRLDAIDHIGRRNRFALWFTAMLTCLLTTAALTGWWYWHNQFNSTKQQAEINKQVEQTHQSQNNRQQEPGAESYTGNTSQDDIAVNSGAKNKNIQAEEKNGLDNNGHIESSRSDGNHIPNGYFNTGNEGNNNLASGASPQTNFNPGILVYIGVPDRIQNQHIPAAPLGVFPGAIPVGMEKLILPDPAQRLPKLYLQLGLVSEYNMNKPSGDISPAYLHKDARNLEQQQVNNGFTVGIKALAGYRLGNRLRFNIGFSLQQQVEQSAVNYTYTEVPFKDPDGKIIEYFDLPQAQWKAYNFSSTKTQLLAEIPLQVGTELPLGSKMVIAPRLGIDARLVMAASGTMYNVDRNQVETINKQSVSRFNFGWNVNLACYYRLNQRIWISAEPYYLQVAKPLAPVGAIVQQTQSSLGLNLFLTYSLVK